MRCWVTAVVAALVLASWVEGARILAFLPFPGKSHQIVFNPVLQALARHGHHIVAFKGSALPNPPANYTETLAPDVMENMKDNFNFIEFGKLGPVSQLIALYEIGLMMCNAFVETEFFKKLLKTDDKFDLIIHESFFVQESMAALAHRFGVPQVAILPLGNSLWANYLMDNPFSPAYVPDYKVPFTDIMNFKERLINTYATAASVLIGDFFYVPKHQALVDKHFIYPGSEKRPPLYDILKNTSLVVVNSHYSLNGAAPAAPNIVNVGGIHIQPSKPLNKELKTWIDGAKEGVIYFSYGTVLRPDLVMGDVEAAFCAAFAKLKQRVVWKHNGKVKNLPPNILLSPWLPQQDILAHNNVKLFITHGGYLSISEAVHFGIPLVGTPFFGDQQKNIRTVVDRGFGLQLDYSNITEESVSWAVNEVLSNPSYRKQIQEASAIFRDRPMKPVDEAVFWVELVIRHGGAPFLRPAVSRLNWFQAYLLDILALIVSVAVVSIGLLYFILSRLCFLFCLRKNRDTSSKKTN